MERKVVKFSTDRMDWRRIMISYLHIHWKFDGDQVANCIHCWPKKGKLLALDHIWIGNKRREDCPFGTLLQFKFDFWSYYQRSLITFWHQERLSLYWNHDFYFSTFSMVFYKPFLSSQWSTFAGCGEKIVLFITSPHAEWSSLSGQSGHVSARFQLWKVWHDKSHLRQQGQYIYPARRIYVYIYIYLYMCVYINI